MMDLLKTLYSVVGAPHPTASLVVALIAGAAFFGGGWWLIGKQYEKDATAGRTSANGVTTTPITASTPKPTASVAVKQNDDGTATLVFKFFDIPKGSNVDWISLALRQQGLEVPIPGSPSAQVVAVHYDRAISPIDLETPGASIDIESRLIPSPPPQEEPYQLAEVTLWWQPVQSQVVLTVTPSFLDAHRKLLPLEIDPASVTITLKHHANSEGRATHLSDVNLGAALDAALTAKDVSDMRIAARDKRFKSAFISEGIWYAAAASSQGALFADSGTVQLRALKALVLATLLDLELAERGESWPTDESLLGLDFVSLKALRDATHLAEPDDPLAALLSRKPKLHETFWRGYYQYLRLDMRDTHERIVMERSDTPWTDLDTTFKVTNREKLPQHPIEKLPAEALSYSFPLDSINFFVIAAKAYASLALLGATSHNAKYANLIIANALFAASRMEGNGHSAVVLARAATFPMQQAIEGFRAAPPKGGHLLSASTLDPELTTMLFFGRRFEAASKRYRNAAASTNREPEFRLYGLRGDAITDIALGNEQVAASKLRELQQALDDQIPTHARYRYFFDALAYAFDETSPIGRLRPNGSLAGQSASLPEDARYALNLDIQRVLWSIGKPRESARLLLREIERLTVNPGASRAVELKYLQELAATIADVFAQISWQFDREGGFLPRHEDTATWLKTFAPTWIDRHSDRGGGRPYGATSPEEDRATCFEAYRPNVPVSTLLQTLVGVRESEAVRTNRIGGELVPWAREASAAGHVEPLLKLAWVEWFALLLAPLAGSESSLEGWKYHPSEIEGVSSPEKIRAAIKLHESSDTQAARVASTFIVAREMLVRRYGS